MMKGLGFDKNGIKKGAWSKEEDEKLRAYIQRYGHWNWGLLPKFAGLSRSGKSCRLRWVNYLRPNMKHGNFTIEEDNMIVDLHNKLGNKWSSIAANLPGRSDNEIKNRWNTHLKKRADQEEQLLLETETIETNKSNQNPNDIQLQEDSAMFLVGESSESPSYSSFTQLSPYWLSGSDCVVPSDFTPQTSAYELAENFWTEPFLLPDIISSIDSMSSPLNIVDDFVPQSSCHDMMMNDEFSWSMLDSYVEYSSELFNCCDN